MIHVGHEKKIGKLTLFYVNQAQRERGHYTKFPFSLMSDGIYY